jgi:hypothetical protein
MSTAQLAPEEFRGLAVDDEFKDRKAIRKKISQRGFPEPRVVTNLAELRRSARGVYKIISLDLKVDNSEDKSFTEAKMLLQHNPKRPVYFLTTYLSSLRVKAKESVEWLFYGIEKIEEALNQLDYIQASIYAIHKCLILARGISLAELNNVNEKQFRGISQEIFDLYSCSSLFEYVFQPSLPVQATHFEELIKILPSQSSLSAQQVKELSEPLLNYAIAHGSRLKEIRGVYEFPEFQKTINSVQKNLLQSQNAMPNKDVGRRYVQAEFPDICKLYQEVNLKICIKKTGINPINIPFAGEKHVELSVKIAGDGFELPSGLLSLTVERSKDSSEVRNITVKPRRTGIQHLFIIFFKDAQEVGSVILRTTVKR